MPIKITPTRNGKFRVKYIAANGEPLAHSEVLNTKQAAKKNIKAMEKLFQPAYITEANGLLSVIAHKPGHIIKWKSSLSTMAPPQSTTGF